MIFTERTIMVVNDSATINKPLILYRGDKNIELKITIAESQFKFRNTDASNVIETTDASYAQLVINTPYNSPIFSDVAATKNGAVIFVITEAMVDEIREVGAYEIQIRLLDDNKQSRASIPPVSNAIEIREPIAIEDGSAVDSNAVNVAKVNRALTTTSEPLKAFDSQGNYIKNNWGDGDPITDAALNKIEVGIDGVNKKIGNVNSQIKEIAKKTITTEERTKLASLENYDDTEIKTNINNKADKNEVFKKSVGININDFDESTRKTFLELQGVDVNYVLGDENVKPSNTTFFEKKLNYFNKSSILSSKQFSETGQITEGDRVISDKIKVSVGKKYYILSTSSNWLDKLFIYDNSITNDFTETGTPVDTIRNDDYPTHNYYYFTAPKNGYIRFDIIVGESDINNIDINVCDDDCFDMSYHPYVEETTIKTEYIPRISKLGGIEKSNGVQYKGSIFVVNDSGNAELYGNYFELEKNINGLRKVVPSYHLNLYNNNSPENITDSALNYNGTTEPFTGRSVTHYIELSQNKSYKILCDSAISKIAFYDSSKNKTTVDDTFRGKDNVFEVASSDNFYLRIEVMNNRYNINICISEAYDGKYHSFDEISTEKTVYNIKLSEIENDCGFINNKLKGLKWYALGDSLTEQGYITNAIAKKTGMILTNYGIGGTRLAYNDNDNKKDLCMAKRWNTMSDDIPDIITVMGGTNDCYYSTLGDLNDKSINTVAGAVYNIIKGIQEKYPSSLLIFANMPVRWDGSYEEYANIVLETCKKYHIPCIDVFHQCGFNEWNKNIFNLDNDLIHVNTEGGKRIASLFINEIEKCFY